jgi:hypothetical protein
MMHLRIVAAAAAIVCLGVGAAPIAAHHGTNISYDRSKTFTAKAVVTEFRYMNPHVQLYFDVTDAKGKVRHWSGELLPNPAMLLRNGWTRKRSAEALMPGTVVTVTAAPARAGGDTALVLKIESERGEDLLGLGAVPGPPAAAPAR